MVLGLAAALGEGFVGEMRRRKKAKKMVQDIYATDPEKARRMAAYALQKYGLKIDLPE